MPAVVVSAVPAAAATAAAEPPPSPGEVTPGRKMATPALVERHPGPGPGGT
ncbi:hypothetical protein OG241_45700 [Streptomyces sp. NBC_01390]|uniref:hypothetical protein n=1 Tax=Streptomyces sp. NBC_01390 TaxID=2903850 RepID=UPI003247C55E